MDLKKKKGVFMGLISMNVQYGADPNKCNQRHVYGPVYPVGIFLY